MTKNSLLILGVLVGLTLSTGAVASSLGAGSSARGESNATERRVAGVITAVEGRQISVTPLQGTPCVTGVVDAKTKVFVNGRAGRIAQLKLTDSVRAELSLDDVWTTIRVETTRK